jgi:hypothetical protein
MWIYISEQEKRAYENLYLEDFLRHYEESRKRRTDHFPDTCPTCGRKVIDDKIINPYPT